MQPFYERKDEEFRCFFSADMTFPAHLHHAAELIFIQEGSLEVKPPSFFRRQSTAI